MLLAACGGATQAPKPTEAPAAPKPTEAAKPAEAAKPVLPREQRRRRRPHRRRLLLAPRRRHRPPRLGSAESQGHDPVRAPMVELHPRRRPVLQEADRRRLHEEDGRDRQDRVRRANDIQPKIAAAIQSGSGPDVIGMRENWATSLRRGLKSTSPIWPRTQEARRRLLPGLDAYTKVGGKYLSLPHDRAATPSTGARLVQGGRGREVPGDHDEWHAAGKKLKDKGHPLGQCLAHSIGDPSTGGTR